MRPAVLRSHLNTSWPRERLEKLPFGPRRGIFLILVRFLNIGLSAEDEMTVDVPGNEKQFSRSRALAEVRRLIRELPRRKVSEGDEASAEADGPQTQDKSVSTRPC